ncbi:MAG: MliC family protein [Pseudomonadota bacterium]
MAKLHILIIAGSAALLALGGCNRAPEKAAEPGAAAETPFITYVCDDGRTVRATYPDPDTAIVDIGGTKRTLKIAISASGARYIGEGVQWWTKGMDQGQLSPLASGEDIATAPGVNCRAKPAGEAAAVIPPPGSPGGLADDRTSISEGAFTPQSAQGAANVVQTYFALLADKKFGEAQNLWSDGGKASGMSAQDFAASFGKYASYNAQIGTPGEIEGGAGSLFVEVPVVVYGTMKTGEPVNLKGKVRLRRVNDVPGATPDQLRWHISETALKPSPGG